VADQPFVALPPGSGPRHLVFSPSGRQAYLTLEMTGSVAVLDYAEGHLKLRQVLPLAPAGFAGAVGAAALHVSPDGRFLAVTDRGADNVLVSFAIDPADGSLRLVDRRAVEGAAARVRVFARWAFRADRQPGQRYHRGVSPRPADRQGRRAGPGPALQPAFGAGFPH
jgi:6-phosphogluconolactonase (cycloisomerase 2 family)